ncbi:MAG: hypothetical protein WCJ19_03090 [bacterium]
MRFYYEWMCLVELQRDDKQEERFQFLEKRVSPILRDFYYETHGTKKNNQPEARLDNTE